MKDTVVSIHPYFKVHPESHDDFKALLPQFIERTKKEADCLYYSFTQHEDIIHCREGYKNAEALLAHTNSVGELIEKALTIAELLRLEIHGPADELAKLKEPLAALPIDYYVLETGFRN
ncbi:antibiotic biosynthesis monooxygenase [Pelagicoccus sp. NFK12]|uniref:Antibiotic biosynthesis monooxygenase n=1 Tax=Pelagicoccus enzymogenes TaxID=2773457 RepID=A0A927F786_9BACT|nr:antibiotic biosynthesis monooxygenase [Pelagicoccus enzymogenes]MBD5778248.1 antibiotic biosynthesis monooxygenase [Pelagicoccus enzymogenes]MDQ8200916.1 antibiotic biosynthesis monooxygenase [Pelagicoccus enzymogenes]